MLVVQINKNTLKEAAAILKNSGVIVYPTDTAYALGGVFDSPKAIKKIFQIKKRKDKKFTLIASGIPQVKKFFTLRPEEERIVRRFWPGAVSLVVSGRYAVRVPKSRVARDLARLARRPIIATSANMSGRATSYSVAEVMRQFGKNNNVADLVLDGGKLKKIPPSTIVRVEKDGILQIVRDGPVSELQLKRFYPRTRKPAV